MDYSSKEKQRKRKVMQQRLIMLAVIAGLFLVALLVSKVTGKKETPAGGAAGVSQPVSQPEGSLDPAAWNFIGPVQQNGAMQISAPDYRMLALPENGRVDISYFNSVTFVGDSITTGLQIYPAVGLPNASYCAYKGIGPKAIYDGSICTRTDGVQELPLEALVASQPNNVYILMGANAMVNTKDEMILEYYREMLNQIRAHLSPDVGYYIQAITPVRPDNASGFTMERIHALNNALAKMAYEEGVYFIDLNEPLAGDDGFLREDFAGSDGLHLSPTGYAAWVDYLVTHTAYHPRNPYLEGSPYYLPPPPATETAEAPPAQEEPPAPEEEPV